ncbi:MAG: type I-C CRISPR-associated protein Cas8c/Csd1 [Candidatus Omnitrophota bacterium]
MIKELSELGISICEKKYGEWNHVALKEEFISIEIVIDEKGNFCKFEPFEKKSTIAEALNSKKGQARLLLDKVEEVLCYGGIKSKKKHDLFLTKLTAYQELSELSPVMAFYKQNKINGVEKALRDFGTAIPDEKNRKGNIGFRIQTEDIRIHEKAEIRRKVIEEYETIKKDALKKNCSVCNKSDYPVEDEPHGMIKKVPDGKSSGCALVSYNEPAFESYDLKGNNNSSICANCARTYVEGLNWLLSEGVKIRNERNKEDIVYSNRWPRKRSASYGVDTAMVFWTRRNNKLDEIDYLEAPNSADVARLIDSVASGAERDNRYLEPDKFYSCTLSGSAARIAVRDWIETSLFDFRKAIAKWFQDIEIEEYDGDLKKIQTHYARLYDLARSCQRKNSDGKSDKDDTSLARAVVYLWNAALKNTSLPVWMLTKVLQRARLDKYGVTADRAALIKLILNRNNKGGDFMITEKIMQSDRPVAYICGQIFAKLENIQYAALGDKNAGIRERYFTYAMTSPASAFGRLFNLNSKHFTKLKSDKPGLAVVLDKECQELCKDVDIRSFPATFSLEQQGQFAIGYYHQRQLQFSGNKSKENKEGK